MRVFERYISDAEFAIKWLKSADEIVKKDALKLYDEILENIEYHMNNDTVFPTDKPDYEIVMNTLHQFEAEVKRLNIPFTVKSNNIQYQFRATCARCGKKKRI